MEIDEVYNKIGQLGIHQVQLLLCLFFINTYASFHMVHMVFVGAPPNRFYCHHGNHLERDVCPGQDVEPCTKFSYTGTDFTSIVTEWDLVCERAYQGGVVQSLFMAGVLLGALIFGYISDSKGRRPALMIGLAGLTTFTLLSAFMTSYSSYLVIRMLAGIFCGGTILVCFVLSTEIVGASKRALISMLMQAVFAVGIMIFALLAYHIRDWRTLATVTAVPGITGLVTMIVLPESPRWLLSQGRSREAEAVLSVIAEKNNSSLKAISLRPLELSVGTTYGLYDLWSHNILRSRTLVQAYCWFVNSCVYYGLTMSAGSLSSSMYISVTLSALVELPAYVATLALIARLGRRWLFCGTMLMGGISCLSIMLTTPGSVMMTVLGLTGKLAISASFAIAYLYSAELYPTVVRNIAMGVCSMAARFGGIVAPLIIAMSTERVWLQFVVFGGLAFSAGVLAVRLPETAGKPMPETIADLDKSRTVPVKVMPLTEDKVRLLEQDILDGENREFQDVEMMA